MADGVALNDDVGWVTTTCCCACRDGSAEDIVIVHIDGDEAVATSFLDVTVDAVCNVSPVGI